MRAASLRGFRKQEREKVMKDYELALLEWGSHLRLCRVPASLA